MGYQGSRYNTIVRCFVLHHYVKRHGYTTEARYSHMFFLWTVGELYAELSSLCHVGVMHSHQQECGLVVGQAQMTHQVDKGCAVDQFCSAAFDVCLQSGAYALKYNGQCFDSKLFFACHECGFQLPVESLYHSVTHRMVGSPSDPLCTDELRLTRE